MKTTRFAEVWSTRNFPADLWLEFLSRLPSKSLLQLRCVSKSWQSLIDSPNFCRLHLCNFKNNIHQTNLFVHQHEVRVHNCVVRCSKTFQNMAKLDTLHTDNECTRTLPNSLTRGDIWHPIFYVDGLVMLSYYHAPTQDLVLWNPSIRKTRTLPLFPAVSKDNVDLGFGFDSSVNDYKHVRLLQDGETKLHSIAVYTVGTGSWKTIQFQHAKRSNWRWSFPSYPWNNKVCCKGILYSLPKNMNSDTQELVSFDLSSEVFDSKSLPPMDVRVIDQARLLVGGDGLLTWLNFSVAASSIWVLEGSGNDMDSRYWTKRYDLDFKICRGGWNDYLYLKNGKLMVLESCNRVSSYDLETEEETIIAKVGRNLRMGNVWGYVESLLLLNG